MNAKEYLNQVRYNDANIASRIDERNRLWISLTSIKSSRIKEISVQESNQKNDNRFEKVLELDRYIDREIDKLYELKLEISKRIDRCDEQMHSIILRERYLNYKSWYDIAVLLNYDKRHILRIHGHALIDFSNHNQDVTKCH